MMQKRSISIQGHRTSLLLEDEFWEQLERIAKVKSLSVPALIALIDRQRVRGNEGNDGDTLSRSFSSTSLASALRVYVLTDLRDGLTVG